MKFPLLETKKEWIQWANEIFESKTGIRWGLLFNNRIIGTCGFHNIEFENKANIAEIGYDLMVNYWGQGIISEVISLIIDYAFSVLKFDEIHALIIPENLRSKKQYQNSNLLMIG